MRARPREPSRNFASALTDANSVERDAIRRRISRFKRCAGYCPALMLQMFTSPTVSPFFGASELKIVCRAIVCVMLHLRSLYSWLILEFDRIADVMEKQNFDSRADVSRTYSLKMTSDIGKMRTSSGISAFSITKCYHAPSTPKSFNAIVLSFNVQY